jgi:hypothetical protein
METWQRKIVLMRMIGRLPASHLFLDWYRYYFSGLRDFNLEHRWGAIVEMLQIVRNADIRVAEKDLAEIGSGWHPLLGLMFFAMGARTIRLTDIAPHIKTEYVDKAISFLLSRVKDISEHSGVPAGTLEKRLCQLQPNGRDFRKVFLDHRMTYHAPLDFTKTGWSDGSLDLVYSNSCFENIPEPILRGIFSEMGRVVKKGGHIAHNLAPVDVLTDSINYLRYSAEEWERIGTCKLHYQNRLRPARYIKMANDAGFCVVYEYRLPYPKPLKLDRAQLHPEFRDLPDSELLTVHFLFAGEKL